MDCQPVMQAAASAHFPSHVARRTWRPVAVGHDWLGQSRAAPSGRRRRASVQGMPFPITHVLRARALLAEASLADRAHSDSVPRTCRSSAQIRRLLSRSGRCQLAAHIGRRCTPVRSHPPCTRRNTTDGAGDWEAVGVGRTGRCMTVPEVQGVQAGSGGPRQAGGSSSLRSHVPVLPAWSCSV
jgi:hypothetical protein